MPQFKTQPGEIQQTQAVILKDIVQAWDGLSFRSNVINILGAIVFVAIIWK